MNVAMNASPNITRQSESFRLFHSGREFEPDWFVVEMCWDGPGRVPTETLVQARYLSAASRVFVDPKIEIRSLPHERLLVAIGTDDAKIDMRVSRESVAIAVQVIQDAEAAVRFCENVASTGARVKSRVQTLPDSLPSSFEPSRSGYLFGRILEQQQTLYQTITLSEHPVYGRAFLLGDEIQIGVEDEHLFSRGMVSHAMTGEVKRVLVLGGGDCGVLREVLTYPVERVVMVELDSEVVEFCKKHFPGIVANAPEDPRVEMRFEDAFEYLKNCNEQFDLVLSDLPDTPIADYTLDDQVRLMEQVLAENGILGTHAEFTRFGQPNESELIVDAIANRFAKTEVVREVIPSFQDQQWLFVKASR